MRQRGEALLVGDEVQVVEHDRRRLLVHVGIVDQLVDDHLGRYARRAQPGERVPPEAG
jgi:hypothetical protein